MVDDGLSRREVLKRMDELKLRVEDVKALVLTHEHSDHIKGLAVWCKNWSGSMFCSPQTRCAKPELEELPFTPVEPGCAVNVAGMRIDTFSTSHDVAGPMGFRFSYQDDSIGYITDTGIITEGAKATLPDARILAIESNHDVPMLRCGSYPRFLQDRIISSTGHLSNQQAADALPALVGSHTQYVIAMQNHKPLTKSSYKSMWKLIERELPNAHVTAHILRHTYITRLFEAGLDIKEVQYLAGHSTVDMTLRVYTHYDRRSRAAQTAEKVRTALKIS